ncbi:MAG: hypothetical protein IJD75_02190 [Clostridia bacterium]|nr:hypothetical protein [Clostridia bacterium]
MMYVCQKIEEQLALLSDVNIRSIRAAAAELKARAIDIGIGEKLIRNAVKDGRIPSICIGNREYIAMQRFNEPYCRRLFEQTATAPVSRAEAVRRDVMEQMGKRSRQAPMSRRLHACGEHDKK